MGLCPVTLHVKVLHCKYYLSPYFNEYLLLIIKILKIDEESVFQVNHTVLTKNKRKHFLPYIVEMLLENAI